MDTKALHKISCGLFVTAVDYNGKRNACITNTLMQQSHAPVKLSLTVQKANFTHDMIVGKGSVAISILSKQVTPELIRRFGYASGRDTEKFADFPHNLDGNGNPTLEGDAVSAVLSLKVYDQIDVGTHTIFLCEPSDMINSDYPAITYTEYQANLKAKKNEGSQSAMKKYVCSVCGYVYDPAKGDPDQGIAPGTPWEEVPDSYVCPTCGVGKDMFEAE